MCKTLQRTLHLELKVIQGMCADCSMLQLLLALACRSSILHGFLLSLCESDCMPTSCSHQACWFMTAQGCCLGSSSSNILEYIGKSKDMWGFLRLVRCEVQMQAEMPQTILRPGVLLRWAARMGGCQCGGWTEIVPSLSQIGCSSTLSLTSPGRQMAITCLPAPWMARWLHSTSTQVHSICIPDMLTLRMPFEC